MGLLDDEYRGAPNPPSGAWSGEWQRTPANDPIHPYVGLLDQLRRQQQMPPEMPPDAPYPDAYFSHPHLIPPGAPDDRAYRPTLQYEDSVPGQREAALAAARRRALEDEEYFLQPKTAAEVGIPEQEPSFQQRLDQMTMGEKLQMLLDRLRGR